MSNTENVPKASTTPNNTKPIGPETRLNARAPDIYEDKTQAAMPRHVAIDAHVLTLEQAQASYSIDSQERLYREFITHKKPHGAHIRIFRDEGQTCTNIKHPGFQTMLQDADCSDGNIYPAAIQHAETFCNMDTGERVISKLTGHWQ